MSECFIVSSKWVLFGLIDVCHSSNDGSLQWPDLKQDVGRSTNVLGLHGLQLKLPGIPGKWKFIKCQPDYCKCYSYIKFSIYDTWNSFSTLTSCQLGFAISEFTYYHACIYAWH